MYNLLRNSCVDITAAYITNDDSLFSEHGTGFFIDDSHVVTAAHLLLASEQRNPPSSYYLNRVQRIVATFKGQLFNLKLVGLSPLNDVAVLEAVNPPSHSYLKWGDSASASAGVNVYTIGNILSMDVKALSEGVLRNNNMTYVSNPMVGQLLDVNLTTGGGNSGAPFVDSLGNVLGIVSFTLNWQQVNVLNNLNYLINTGTTCGPSQAVAQRIVDDILAGRNVTYVADVFGPWLHWVQSSLGASYNYVTPTLRLTTLEGTSVSSLKDPIVSDKVDGVMIDSIEAGSSLNEYLYPGDIITAVNGNRIGYVSSAQKSLGQLLSELPINADVDLSVMVKNYNYALTSIPAVTQMISQASDHIRKNVQVLNTGNTSNLAFAIGTLVAAVASLVVAVVKLTVALVGVAIADTVTFGAATIALGPPLATLGVALFGLAKAEDNLIKTINGIAKSDVQKYVGNNNKGNIGSVVNKGVNNGDTGLNGNNLYLGNGITDTSTTSVLIPTSFFEYQSPIYFTVQPGSYNTKLVAGVYGPAGQYRPFLEFTYWIYTEGGVQLFGAVGNLNNPPTHGFTVKVPTVCRVQVSKNGKLGNGVRVVAFFIVPSGTALPG